MRWVLSSLEARAVTRRAECAEQWAKSRTRTQSIWLGIASVYGAIWLLIHSLNFGSFQLNQIWVFLSIPSTLIMQDLAVRLFSSFEQEHHRSLVRASWYEALLTLSLPWITAVPFGLIVLFMNAVMGSHESFEPWIQVIMVLLGLLFIPGWMLLSFASLMSWFADFEAACSRHWVIECKRSLIPIHVLGVCSGLWHFVIGVLFAIDLLEFLPKG